MKWPESAASHYLNLSNNLNMEQNDKDKRMLLIVDPQIDFINGTLPVPGAEDAMNNLARYIHDFGHLYGHIIITCDRHNLRHVSFKEYGGEWPPHCVESSVGAAVWPAVMQELPQFSAHCLFLYKGENHFQDEYSIFRAEEGRRAMALFLSGDRITHVDICGLAGDVCVKTTLQDALRLYPDKHYRILEDCTASLDDGKAIGELSDLLRNHNHKLDVTEENKCNNSL